MFTQLSQWSTDWAQISFRGLPGKCTIMDFAFIWPESFIIVSADARFLKLNNIIDVSSIRESASITRYILKYIGIRLECLCSFAIKCCKYTIHWRRQNFICTTKTFSPFIRGWDREREKRVLSFLHFLSYMIEKFENIIKVREENFHMQFNAWNFHIRISLEYLKYLFKC